MLRNQGFLACSRTAIIHDWQFSTVFHGSLYGEVGFVLVVGLAFAAVDWLFSKDLYILLSYYKNLRGGYYGNDEDVFEGSGGYSSGCS